MGCQLSKKKGFCRICKKCKDQKAEGAAEINETHAVAHTSQEASECTESQPFTGTRKDTEQATVEAQPRRSDGVPAAPSSQETPEDTEETLSVLQTVQGYEAQTTAQSTGKASQDTDAQPAAEMEQEIGEAEPNTKVTQNRQPVKQDWQLASCITEDYVEDQPALEAMQEAGKMDTTVQTTVEIVEGQPTAENIQETPQYTGETQPTLQTAQEREVQPISESEQEAGETQSAGKTTEETEAWPDADRVQESRAHSVTQDREPAAQCLSVACTTDVTKQAAQEEQAQTTACSTRESWTVQDEAEVYPAAQTKEQTGAQLVAHGPLETQPTIQTIEAPQGTTKNMQIMEDISVGPAEPKASQESPLEPVTIPIKLTIEKTQPTAQATQEMEALHPAQTKELKENQGQQNDVDSQSPSDLAGYKERRGNSAIQEEEDQAPELEVAEVPKPEQQQLNVEQLAPPRELPFSHVPENHVEKCQLLEEAENAETPIPSETQGSEGEMALASDSTANSDAVPASEEPQRTEVTDSMSEPYNLCRRTCCT
ncbi:putative surface protein SACOL0050 [Mauremys reevesii]|uniref:putative surface protein SACOL0050 n=1 Tax=Mauremys reevesii TaxID=260615 RepID=UPI00193F056F|nr:putative surface protein SACOL0050 [Mauremys reevesii]